MILRTLTLMAAVAAFSACSKTPDLEKIAGLCEAEEYSLGALYSITRASDKDSALTQSEFGLWRSEALVMHQYPNADMSLLWNMTPKGALKQTRYFDADSRAVEYEAGAPVSEPELSWQEKYQILPSVVFAGMQKKSEIKMDCGTVAHYVSESDSSSKSIYWSNSLNLPIYIHSEAKGVTNTWQLLSIKTDKPSIRSEFLKRDKFISTDFADIGDNETDPFFRKMINLGFIEHGASGFYDADGNNMGSAHSAMHDSQHGASDQSVVEHNH